MEQVPQLVQWLISIGANIETIGPYPLHALMQLCIQASECSSHYSSSELPFQLWALGLSWAQAKPECGHLNVKYLNDLIIQMDDGSRETASFVFILRPGCYKRPKLKGFCVPRHILAAGWSPGTQGGDLGQTAFAGQSSQEGCGVSSCLQRQLWSFSQFIFSLAQRANRCEQGGG